MPSFWPISARPISSLRRPPVAAAFTLAADAGSYAFNGTAVTVKHAWKLVAAAPITGAALLHFDGADTSSTITDEYGHTWTASGAELDDAQQKFGPTSCLFVRTVPEFINGDGSADFAFGSSDFIVDLWARHVVIGLDEHTFYDARPAGGNGAYLNIHVSTAGKLRVFVNNIQQITGTTTVTAGVWHHILVSRVAGTTRAFLDGNLEGSFADSTVYLNPANRPRIGSNTNSETAFSHDGWIDELRIIKGTGVSSVTPPSAPYSGIAGYLFSGQAVSVLHNWKIAANAGAYAFTGSDAAIVPHVSKTLPAAAGSYAFTGTAATVRHGWRIPAVAGSYGFTGSAATIQHGYKITAAAGSYVFTGTAATIEHGWKIPAGIGSYLFTGAAATLKHDWRIAATAGSYSFSGQAATLRHAWRLIAAVGAYSFTGSDAAIIPTADKSLLPEAGSYVFTGADATVRKSKHVLVAEAGSYSFTGTAVTLRHAWRLPAAVGSYVFTGQAATLQHGWKLPANAGSYTFTGQAAVLRHGWKIAANAGTYSFVGQDATLRHAWRLPAAAGSYLFTGTDAVISPSAADVFVVAGLGSYLFSGSAASVLHNWKLPANAGSYLFTGQPVTLRHAWRITALAGSYTFTGQDAQIIPTVTIVITADSGAYLFTGQSVNINIIHVGVAGGAAATGHWDWEYPPTRPRVRGEVAARETALADRAQIIGDVSLTAILAAIEDSSDQAAIDGEIAPTITGKLRSFEHRADAAAAHGKIVSVTIERYRGRVAKVHFDLSENNVIVHGYERGNDSATIGWIDDEADIRRAILMMAGDDG